MRHQRTFAILFAMIFSLNNQAAELRQDIPKATWEPIFFESINKLAKRADWKPLRETSLSSGSLEIRVWIGFGLAPLQGYLFRKNGAQWAGHYVIESLNQTNLVTARDITPKNGWDKFETELVQLDIFNLPDSSVLGGEKMIFDGVSYVIEINQNGTYRTYEYSNPQEQAWPEAKKMVSLAQVIQDQFATK